MTRPQDALERRDQAFFFARDYGRMDRRGNRLALCALDEFFNIMFAHNSYAGRDEWCCDIWFTPGGFSDTGDGRGFKCLSMVWNAHGEYGITTFKRGAWEEQCMALNNDAYRSTEKGAHNQHVSDRVRQMLNDANRDPAAYLRLQNGIVTPAAANTPRLFDITHRNVNLDEDAHL